jgi:hypothetical protein
MLLYLSGSVMPLVEPGSISLDPGALAISCASRRHGTAGDFGGYWHVVEYGEDEYSSGNEIDFAHDLGW